VVVASWSDLVGYVRSNYKIADEQPEMLKLVFELDGLRSQVVFLWHLTLVDGQEDWVQIESPIGDLGAVDLLQALQQISNAVCGGLAVYGQVVTFRHAVPLLNLNINELERPLSLVIHTADRLERMLTGADKY
jgi:hypothetical protein